MTRLAASYAKNLLAEPRECGVLHGDCTTATCWT
jgi:streptomycin 6-kinase